MSRTPENHAAFKMIADAVANVSSSLLNATNSSSRPLATSELSAIRKLCFMFLDGRIEMSHFLSISWLITAVTSFSLNGMAFKFFWGIKNNQQIHEFLILNLLCCHMFSGCLIQIVVSILYFRDVCLLRVICFIGTIFTTQFSLVSYIFLSVNQLFMLSGLLRSSIWENSYEVTLIVILPSIWLYSCCISLLKIFYPGTNMPVIALLLLTLILIALFGVISLRLRTISRRFAVAESQEENRTAFISLAININRAFKTITCLLILTVFTWLPATLVTFLFKHGFIVQSSKMHVALRAALSVLFLAPSLDFVCLLMRTPRLAKFVKQNLLRCFSLHRKIAPERF